MDYFLILPVLASFFIVVIVLPLWIKKAKHAGLVWEDMNKNDGPLVAGSGGIVALLAFVIGVLILIAYRTFILNTNTLLIEIFALLSSILFFAGVGLIDDLFGWKRGGLRRRDRIFLFGLAAIPLMVINAGRSGISLPFLGNVELGLIYPIFFIPLGIVGATTTFNFLAGFNGLESGQGIILLSALGTVAFFTGNTWLSVVCAIMVASLLGFILFNFYPAKVFPGNSLTCSMGGLIAIIAIFGNFEKIAVFFFIPYIIEFVLKVKGRLVKQSFGSPEKNGDLSLKYDKIYSLNHLAILLLNKSGVKASEKKAVILIWSFQILVVLAGFIIFREGIFL